MAIRMTFSFFYYPLPCISPILQLYTHEHPCFVRRAGHLGSTGPHDVGTCVLSTRYDPFSSQVLMTLCRQLRSSQSRQQTLVAEAISRMAHDVPPVPAFAPQDDGPVLGMVPEWWLVSADFNPAARDSIVQCLTVRYVAVTQPRASPFAPGGGCHCTNHPRRDQSPSGCTRKCSGR